MRDNDLEPFLAIANALKAFTQPPETIRPLKFVFEVADRINLTLKFEGVILGFRANISAATPETCGQAILVPLKATYPASDSALVEYMSAPGAAKSTLFDP